jgi:hypothetical protein
MSFCEDGSNSDSRRRREVRIPTFGCASSSLATHPPGISRHP